MILMHEYINYVLFYSTRMALQRWIQACIINSILYWMVTQIHLNECVWSDGNSFCHLICCCWSSSGMREYDVYIQNDTKACLYWPHSARLPVINLTVEGSWGASWACFEAAMLDSLNRTAGMMSTQWQNKQRFQAHRWATKRRISVLPVWLGKLKCHAWY